MVLKANYLRHRHYDAPLASGCGCSSRPSPAPCSIHSRGGPTGAPRSRCRCSCSSCSSCARRSRTSSRSPSRGSRRAACESSRNAGTPSSAADLSTCRRATGAADEDRRCWNSSLICVWNRARAMHSTTAMNASSSVHVLPSSVQMENKSSYRVVVCEPVRESSVYVCVVVEGKSGMAIEIGDHARLETRG